MNPQRDVLHGLYVILDAEALRGRSMVDALTIAAEAGARLFQYRDKRASMQDAYRTALDLKKAAAEYDAILIVNDRCDLALAVEADGVHLGQADLPVAHARSMLGADRLIGLSTHTAAQVRAAAADAVDYLGFGPIFTPRSKPDHEPVVGVDGLRAARPLARVPVFAIGGIRLDAVSDVMAAGADGVAVISAIWTSADVQGAIQAFLTRIEAGGRRAR